MRASSESLGWLSLLLAACTSGTTTPGVAPPPIATAGAPAPTVPQRPLPEPTRSADGTFARHVLWGDHELLCNGQGLCEWGVFGIDLYTAAFYCERPTRDFATALTPDQRTVFHLHFVRSLTGAQLAEAYTASTKVNTGDRFGDFAAPLQQLVAAMQTVQAGDRYTFFGAPGQGLTIARNGAVVGKVFDDAFRRLFVQLYLGDQPPTAALRKALLGTS